MLINYGRFSSSAAGAAQTKSERDRRQKGRNDFGHMGHLTTNEILETYVSQELKECGRHWQQNLDDDLLKGIQVMTVNH